LKNSFASDFMTRPIFGLSAAKDGKDGKNSAPAPAALVVRNWRREIEPRPSPLKIEPLVMNSSPRFSVEPQHDFKVEPESENCQDYRKERFISFGSALVSLDQFN
jgi:hypothetical protein